MLGQSKNKLKKNLSRNIEIKNNLTIARGEWGGTVGAKGFRNYYKGHMDKTKGEGGSRGCLLYTSDAADDPRVV